MYSKCVCFYLFMSNKFFDFFRNMLNSKTDKISNFNNGYIQSNPMCTNIYIFIKTYYISTFLYFLRLIISRMNSIEPRFILIIPLYFKVCTRMRQIKISFYFHNHLSQFLFLLYFHNLILTFFFLSTCLRTN